MVFFEFRSFHIHLNAKLDFPQVPLGAHKHSKSFLRIWLLLKKAFSTHRALFESFPIRKIYVSMCIWKRVYILIRWPLITNRNRKLWLEELARKFTNPIKFFSFESVDYVVLFVFFFKLYLFCVEIFIVCSRLKVLYYTIIFAINSNWTIDRPTV